MASNPTESGGNEGIPRDEQPGQRPAGSPDAFLLAIAGRILDGEPIDWSELRSRPDLQSTAMLDQLRLLESLAASHRSLQRDESPGRSWENLRQWGHLEIIEAIGQGSFGTVYHAWDPKLDREVALKILHPALAPSRPDVRTIDEARLLARVHHPNVVTVYGADEIDGLTGIWMELIQGETLGDLVRRQGPLSAHETMTIGHDLLSALAAVHAAGILHRDIKLQNVMRASGGRIVLMDLGIGEDLRGQHHRAQDWALGAALYAAPERLRGGDATVRSDLYGLGVLLYHLVTTRFPFGGGNLRELLEAHELGARVYLRDRRPDLPRAFVEMIERALCPDPEDRYASAGEMDAALSAAGKPAPASRSARRIVSLPKIRLPRSRWGRAACLLPFPLLAAFAVWLSTLGRYSVEASLFRSLHAGGQISLTEDDALSSGDHLFAEFRATRDLYVYILQRTEDGTMMLLFPSSLFQKQNPIPRKVLNRLPGPIGGREVDWPGPKGGGKVQYLLIACPERQLDLEAGFKGLNQPDYPQASDETGGRGTGDLAVAFHWHNPFTSGIRTGQLLLHAPPLTPKKERVKGLWIRKLDVTLGPR